MIIDFEKPWVAIKGEDADGLAEELRREVSKGHPLHGVPVRAIAENDETYDDFLFSLEDGTGRVAFVHLTWKKESSPEFPFTQIYQSVDDFFKDCVDEP
ncbi:MAG: hypothetical protein GY722_02375 [bacterium]|nr:hypothetical protein [bacterium]